MPAKQGRIFQQLKLDDNISFSLFLLEIMSSRIVLLVILYESFEFSSVKLQPFRLNSLSIDVVCQNDTLSMEIHI